MTPTILEELRTCEAIRKILTGIKGSLEEAERKCQVRFSSDDDYEIVCLKDRIYKGKGLSLEGARLHFWDDKGKERFIFMSEIVEINDAAELRRQTRIKVCGN